MVDTVQVTQNPGYSNTYRDFERGNEHSLYTNKGLVVDKYVRNNQEWIVPRRVMCAFFWAGIILLFTGIILLVTSKHKEGSYKAWGAVLLGLGFCLLLICLILCMHAYCVITVSDDEPPLVRTVRPPHPATMLSLINGHKPCTHGNPESANCGATNKAIGHNISTVSYGSIQHFSENPQQTKLKSVPEELDAGAMCSCHTDEAAGAVGISNNSSPHFYLRNGGGSSSFFDTNTPRGKKKLTFSPVIDDHLGSTYLYTDTMSTSGSLSIDQCNDKGNTEKKSLETVGKLPSYNTAIKLPPYSMSPERKRAYSYDTEVDIQYLKEDIKLSTLERRKNLLRKTVTFDDPTGDARIEFNGGESDTPETELIFTNISKDIVGYVPNISNDNIIPNIESSSYKSNVPYLVSRLGSPAYDNEVEFKDAVELLQYQKQQLPPPLLASSLSTAARRVPLSTIPESPSSILLDNRSPASAIALTSTTWSYLSPQTHVPLLNAIAPPPPTVPQKIDQHSSSSDLSTSTTCGEYEMNPLSHIHSNADTPVLFIGPIDTTDIPHSHVHHEPKLPQDAYHIDKEMPTTAQLNTMHQHPFPISLPSTSVSKLSPPQGDIERQLNDDEDSVTLRKQTLNKQPSTDDSSGSSKMSVYDNVQYAWKTKSGSELKHFHF